MEKMLDIYTRMKIERMIKEYGDRKSDEEIAIEIHVNHVDSEVVSIIRQEVQNKAKGKKVVAKKNENETETQVKHGRQKVGNEEKAHIYPEAVARIREKEQIKR